MLRFSILGVFLMTGGFLSAQDRIASHPPLRSVPPPLARPAPAGPVFYVDPVRGDDSQAGGKETPWKTIAHALEQLQPGMTLWLRGGVYHEPITVRLAGRPDAPITIASHPREQAIIDGGLRAFLDDPSAAWETVPGSNGEYRSSKRYPNLRNVYGWFGDSLVGLHTYYHAQDLRAPSELWEPLDPTPTKKGAVSDIKPLYCGPGLWYDAESGRIHCRLSHTHLPDGVNYRGETDPRRLRLIIAPFRSVPLRLDGARHVRIHDLVLRGAGHDTITLEQTRDIEIDNVTVWSGSYGLRGNGAQGLKVTRCGFYGSVPPWTFRTDSSLRTYPERGQRDLVRYGTHAHVVADAGREFAVYAFPRNDDWEIAHCDFTDAHDGVYLGGINLRFHHNRVHELQDDGLYLSPMYMRYSKRPAEVHVYQNYIGHCLTALAFGGPEKVTTDIVLIYRNVIDQTHAIRTGRPSSANPKGSTSKGHVMSDHGSPPWSRMRIYHNTCVMEEAARDPDMGFLSAATIDRPRQVFNNLHVHLARLPIIAGPPGEIAVYDGMLYWSPAAPAVGTKLFAKFRATPAFELSKKLYAPGLHAASRFGDPHFAPAKGDDPLSAFMPLEKSAALDAGVDLPTDCPDPVRTMDAGRPDIGALPRGVTWRTGRR